MAEDKRERLLDACKAVVARKGVHGATVAEVAREADITPGLVHYYFPSKQALMLALFDRLTEDFAARLRGGDGVRGFVRAALALGDDADPDGVRVWVWLSAEALRDDALQERWRDAVALWVEQLTEALGERELAGAVVSGVLGAWQLGTVAPGVLPAGSAAQAQGRMVDALLGSGDG